jgi:hypothetical protein
LFLKYNQNRKVGRQKSRKAEKQESKEVGNEENKNRKGI